MKDRIFIRKAEERDLQQLLDIYNYEVEHGVATLDLRPKTMKEWKQWFQVHNVDNHPLLVAEMEGRVAGYASLSSYRERRHISLQWNYLSMWIGPAGARELPLG